jgi:PHD/YefM family antitoxin component YafN of YafNO toxin-antitoxin module
MKKVNALELRQSLGKVIATLQRTGEPILLEKARKPVGVLISLKDFQERFVERSAADARKRILEEIDSLARPGVDPTPTVEVLRQLRGTG